MLRKSVLLGKAGGFLALDWNDTSPVGPLARLSFKLHKQLAKSLGEDYGYRCVDTLGVGTSEEHQPVPRIQHQNVPAWVDKSICTVQVGLSGAPCVICSTLLAVGFSYQGNRIIPARIDWC